MRRLKSVYQLFADFLKSWLNRPQYLLYVATLVGITSGLVAVLLKKLVHYLQHWIEKIPAGPTYLIFPGIGLLVTVFIVKHYYKEHYERGIAMVLKSIAQRSSIIPLTHCYIHVITSTITVGVGGSVGLESPIVATGSAIGSNIARINSLSYKERSLLIACGAAAGIAGVFNAPVAGLIFAIEVLLAESAVTYFIPLIISAAIGALCSKIILEESILFNFRLKQNFNYQNIPAYVILGIISGFIALYYARTFKKAETKIHDWNINSYTKALCGGVMLMALCFIFPPLFGEGYTSVKLVANGNVENISDNSIFFQHWEHRWDLLLFSIFIVLLKPLAAAITIGSGGNGGNFAPSLFSGAYLGFAYARLLNNTTLVNIPEGNFSLAGMAGVLSGVMYCPLTAIFLIAEITNGYELFIPLMIVSSISYFIVKHFEPYSMEIKQLALQGQVFTNKREQNILSGISLQEMLHDTYLCINMNKTLSQFAEMVAESDKNVFAVVDDEEKFAGIIELNDIRRTLLRKDRLDNLLVRDVMKIPSEVIYPSDNMQKVMEKFDRAKTWYLPVLTSQSQFISFVSKTKLFNKYREVLSDQIDIY